jgi:hypothetical protein
MGGLFGDDEDDYWVQKQVNLVSCV